MRRRAAIVAYGLASYVVFLGVILYAVGLVEGVGVPRSVDDPPTPRWPRPGFIGASCPACETE